MKRIVVSQTMFFPWAGLFEQVRLADAVDARPITALGDLGIAGIEQCCAYFVVGPADRFARSSCSTTPGAASPSTRAPNTERRTLFSLPAGSDDQPHGDHGQQVGRQRRQDRVPGIQGAG